jgi:hypothetical protein
MPSGPKNQKFFNRHAAEAQERDQARASDARSAKQRELEDAKWRETDPKILKAAAKEQEERERQAERERLQLEKKAQLDEEDKTLSKGAPKKVTQKQLQREMAKMLASYDRDFSKVRGGDVVADSGATDLPSGNVNKDSSAAASAPTTVNASGVDAGIAALGATKGKGRGVATPYTGEDRNIGKRARVAFRKFSEDNLKAVKEDKPGMTRTQYNDLLWKMWQKSPLNPFVQRAEGRAAEAAEREKNWMLQSDSDEEEA